MKGIIKTVRNGYAFIEIEGEKRDLFVHINDCAFDAFVEGQEVEFEKEYNEKKGKDRAVNCRLAGGKATADEPGQGRREGQGPENGPMGRTQAPAGDSMKGIVAKKPFGLIISPFRPLGRQFKDKIAGIEASGVEEGDVVAFRTVQEGRDLKPRDVRVATKRDAYESEFVNPYNFVPVQVPSSSERTPLEHDHGRFHEDGYCGKIRCKMTGHSPMFIPDTRTKREDPGEKDHWHYDFFRIDGLPAIPATSIKGMLRSVYETLTNSCFSQINDESEKINFREKASGGLEPGIVLALPDRDNKRDGIILKCECAWIDKYFPPRQAAYNIGTGMIPVSNIPDGLRDGQRICFSKRSHMYQKRNQFPLEHAVDVGSGPTHGYLKITGKKADARKHNERVFFHERFDGIADLPAKSSGLSRFKERFPEQDLYSFGLDEKHTFDSIQRTQINTEKAMIFSEERGLEKGTVYYHTGLQEGDLVYFKPAAGSRAENVAYVNIPKSSFKKNVRDLLKAYSKHLLPCENIEALCPACKLFGAADLKKGDMSVSLAGRVSITDARLASGEKFLKQENGENITLRILGSPHETAANFYLIGRGYDNEKAIVKKSGQGYDTRPTPFLRGRKFYWHQCDDKTPLDPAAYRCAKKSNQNATVELLDEGAVFEFDVFFENLSKDEVGLLMFAIELGDGLFHKIGHGKPLGLGTVSIETVDSQCRLLTHEDLKAYYLDIHADEKKGFEISSQIRPKNYADLVRILRPHPELFGRIKNPSAVAVAGANAGESFGYEWFRRFGDQQLKTVSETAGENGEPGMQRHYSDDVK